MENFHKSIQDGMDNILWIEHNQSFKTYQIFLKEMSDLSAELCRELHRKL